MCPVQFHYRCHATPHAQQAQRCNSVFTPLRVVSRAAQPPMWAFYPAGPHSGWFAKDYLKSLCMPTAQVIRFKCWQSWNAWTCVLNQMYILNEWISEAVIMVVTFQKDSSGMYGYMDASLVFIFSLCFVHLSVSVSIFRRFALHGWVTSFIVSFCVFSLSCTVNKKDHLHLHPASTS